ncbi:hypothetical protein TWF730_003691 [Orbilia blumenaviensis]|uniref:Uncharacterized protein n=1 Tax=Orbilia blumenaviensis TaxID=1796055 RepID=A0AAV9U6D4_9PEZI
MASSSSATAFKDQAFAKIMAGDGDEHRKRALDAVDKIRGLSLGDMSLPQIVALGDQSCGKSSVLESLTSIPFPASSGLCTRHATQFVLRRGPAVTVGKAMVVATITPGEFAMDHPALKKRLEAFRYEKEEGGFVFEELLEAAAKAMGIRIDSAAAAEETYGATGATPTRRFSDDILKIELSGPNYPHLTIVDVPGLFHGASETQTKEDIEMVRKLILKYMQDPGTIMLAVMDGSVHPNNQEIFTMAKDADPTGQRTVGVITKCDTVQAGNEMDVVKAASNAGDHRLHHGWFLVKNRSPLEIRHNTSLAQRHANEAAFFSKKPWSTLPKSQIGTSNLRNFLSRLLYQQIQSKIPEFARGVNDIIMTAKKELEVLGVKRDDDVTLQRQYLTILARNCEIMVLRCLETNLGALAQRHTPLKIRTITQKLNERFAEEMRGRGHTRCFKGMEGDEDPAGCNSLSDAEGSEDGGFVDSLEEKEKDMSTWILKHYNTSRGPELKVLINPYIVLDLFRLQSHSWPAIAKSHVTKVITAVENFNTELFNQMIPDQTVRRRLKMKLAEETSRRLLAAHREVENVVAAEFGGILQTVDAQFEKVFRDLKRERIVASLTSMVAKGGISAASPVTDAPGFPDFIKCFEGPESIVGDIHDVLKAYYPIALERFIAAINQKVVEERLLGEEGPIQLFKPEFIALLGEEELRDITKEDTEVAERRGELEGQLEMAGRALVAINSI